MKNEVTQLEDLKAVEKVLTKEKYDIYKVYKLIGMRLFPNMEINGAEDTEKLIERTIDLITLLKTDNIILNTKEDILKFLKFINKAAITNYDEAEEIFKDKDSLLNLPWHLGEMIERDFIKYVYNTDVDNRISNIIKTLGFSIVKEYLNKNINLKKLLHYETIRYYFNNLVKNLKLDDLIELNKSPINKFQNQNTKGKIKLENLLSYFPKENKRKVTIDHGIKCRNFSGKAFPYPLPIFEFMRWAMEDYFDYKNMSKIHNISAVVSIAQNIDVHITFKNIPFHLDDWNYCSFDADESYYSSLKENNKLTDDLIKKFEDNSYISCNASGSVTIKTQDKLTDNETKIIKNIQKQIKKVMWYANRDFYDVLLFCGLEEAISNFKNGVYMKYI